MKRLVLVAAAASSVAYGDGAFAEPPRRGDRTAAEALFYEARALMKDGKYALACTRFEESLRLDYGIGTDFNLADCNEKTGKLATAWSGFLRVASAAKVHDQRQREKVARARAKALEPKLPKLAIDVPSPAPPDLEVKRDGVALESASWGTPTPVDPGDHRVTASAPGKQPWEGSVSAAAGKVVRISVPRDLKNVASTELLSASPVAQRDEPQRQAPSVFPEPIVERNGSAQRTIGWIMGGLGVAGVGVGAGFGIDSLQRRDRSKAHCTGDTCDSQGVALRDKALQSGDISTVSMVAGGAALLGGIILVLTAPKGPSDREAPPTTAAARFHAVPHVATNGGGISFQGILP